MVASTTTTTQSVVAPPPQTPSSSSQAQQTPLEIAERILSRCRAWTVAEDLVLLQSTLASIRNWIYVADRVNSMSINRDRIARSSRECTVSFFFQLFFIYERIFFK